MGAKRAQAKRLRRNRKTNFLRNQRNQLKDNNKWQLIAVEAVGTNETRSIRGGPLWAGRVQSESTDLRLEI